MNGEFLEDAFAVIATGFELLGTIAMVVGFIIAAYLGINKLVTKQGALAAFHTLKTTIGGAILLGLEILVAADLVRTVTSKPSLEDAFILGLIVVIRTILSMSIQIEIEGVLPWRRALLTSGASVIAHQIDDAGSRKEKNESSKVTS